jgi:hypothetical protein
MYTAIGKNAAGRSQQLELMTPITLRERCFEYQGKRMSRLTSVSKGVIESTSAMSVI